MIIDKRESPKSYTSHYHENYNYDQEQKVPDLFGIDCLNLAEEGDSIISDLSVQHNHMVRTEYKRIYDIYAIYDNYDINNVP